MLKKVGILTFSQATNYGALLQEYALLTTIREYGLECEIINYINDKFEVEYSVKETSIKKCLKELLTFRSVWGYIKRKKFSNFEKKYIVFSKDCYRKNTIDQVNDLYDVVITGSDQVFNPKLTDFDWNYFLANIVQNKSSAYAPSFGVPNLEEFSTEVRALIGNYLSNIRNLSVRENSGKEIIYSLTQREVPVVLDPTLLLEKEKWLKFIQKPTYKAPYVLLYTFETGEINRLAEEYASARGMKIIKINASIKDIMKPSIIIKNSAGIEEFLSLIYYADSIITNSYHGMLFSFIFEKKFFVYPHKNSDSVNDRMEDFLTMFDISDRIIRNNTMSEIALQYDDLKEKLKSYRASSKCFLENVLVYKESCCGK